LNVGVREGLEAAVGAGVVVAVQVGDGVELAVAAILVGVEEGLGVEGEVLTVAVDEGVESGVGVRVPA
jgi:hypothetical protein